MEPEPGTSKKSNTAEVLRREGERGAARKGKVDTCKSQAWNDMN